MLVVFPYFLRVAVVRTESKKLAWLEMLVPTVNGILNSGLMFAFTDLQTNKETELLMQEIVACRS